MFGAIFLQEMLVAGRRQRGYFLRWLYAAVLLVQLAPRVLTSIFLEMRRPGSSALAVYGSFLDQFTDQHFLYLLVLTPALTAGAIADDKLRGTLDHLLTTCLHPIEIVLGKLLARICQLLVFALVALPIVAFFGVIADRTLPFALTLLAASAIVIAGTAALGMLASVWCQRTRDAVLVTYLVLIAGVVVVSAVSAAGWDGPAETLSPWHAIARADDPTAALRLLRLAAAWLLPALVCVGLASWRLRPAYERLRQGTRTGWTRWRLPAMPASANPVRWRERCVQGIAPLARLRAIPVWLAAPTFAVVCAAAFGGIALTQMSGQHDLRQALADDGLPGLHAALRLDGVDGQVVAGPVAGVAVFVLTLLLAVRASGGITDERERASWDALLLTPLATPEIVRGKFWGMLRAYLPYVAAFAVVALPATLLLSPEALATGCGSVGVLLLAAPLIASVGLYCSARLRSSWRSLLATLAVCYGYVILIASNFAVAGCIAGCGVNLLMIPLRRAFEAMPPGMEPLAVGLTFVITNLLLNAVVIVPCSWVLLQWTEGCVDKRKRAHVSRLELDQQRLLEKLNRLADELAEEQA